MTRLAVGTRLRSSVCDTEVIVVSAPDRDLELTCGGATMIGFDEDPPSGGTVAADASEGTLLGKRYVNDGGDLELLCTKPGTGSLGLDSALLLQKDAKPLPSSD